MPTFRHESVVNHAPEDVFAWHERPGAFERLAPPWESVEVVERTGEGVVDGARVTLRVRKGPAALTWELEHRGYEAGRRFQDVQVRGPFSSWVHTHVFEPTPAGGCVVRDEIEWEAPLGAAGTPFARPLVERELRRLFRFRHERLRNDLRLHARYADRPRLKVAISGASGLVGSALGHFLTSGGHRVLPMVRRKADAGADGIFWSWKEGIVDEDALVRADAVVHLAGEPLVSVRWTEDKKRAIRESRVEGTKLVARTMAGLHAGPGTLVCASGVDYYGPRGDEVLTEESRPGRGFLAEVCQAWEAATERASRSGVRVVNVRTGPVLTPAGGMLDKMLPAFRLGLGGRVGRGRQYLSWIDHDDLVGLYHHALMRDDLSGPLNGTAPLPVTNATFANALGRVLGRPTVVPVPSLGVKLLFGQMGKELLLGGQRARPQRALASGYDFLFEGVEESLRHQLGRAGGEG